METKIYRYLVAACLFTIFSAVSTASLAEDEPFVGEMIWVPYNFAPEGWAFCNGQTLQISQYPNLFAILGTTYGGDGSYTFALPNMQGRVMVGAAQGLYYTLGHTGGESSHTLTINEMPAHSHTFQASTATGTANTPSSARVYGKAASGKLYGPGQSASMPAVGSTPGVEIKSHNNMMPYTTLNCIIALDGVYPQP
jgi:microcystin-dependent protein